MEMVPAETAKAVDAAIPVPTIGIGAGNATTGQVLVWQDMAGLRGGRMAKFVKQYADLRTVLSDAAKAYGEDVRSGQFPGPEHSFSFFPEGLGGAGKISRRRPFPRFRCAP
jgi:3-methyl-2-oxobutanoate hydroxymethyltransferase